MQLTRSTCPQRNQYGPAFKLVCDWLATNGIDEVVPEQPTFEVNNTERHIIYRAFQFIDGQRGHDLGKLRTGHFDILVEDRVVPLVEPLSPTVRDAFQRLEDEGGRLRATLIEIHHRTSRSTRDNGFADRVERVLAQSRPAGS